MKPEDKSNHQDDPPPVFGSWRRVYWFVSAFFAIQVVGYYLFTRYYS